MTDTEETLFNAYLAQKELADSADRQAAVLMQEYQAKKAQADAYRAAQRLIANDLGLTC